MFHKVDVLKKLLNQDWGIRHHSKLHQLVSELSGLPMAYKIERLQQRVWDLELQQEERGGETDTGTDSDGDAQPDDFIDWPSTVERVFDLKDIPDKYKVKLVAIKLRKYASLWWDHIKKQRAQEGRSKVETWSKMKKLLCEKFLPVNHWQESFLEYHGLSQRTSTVEEFITEFDRLRMRCGFEEPEEQVIALFLGALRPEISDIVQLQP
ncbi:reverse transcriptase domain-containing protein [Tanacetum coccineum]|uniref:Reverse transcriptase domain-containing protein n=1 Tax=Tanacetum coccineum TaxID=301880 RepID=A0ABQ4Z544_9ASTR